MLESNARMGAYRITSQLLLAALLLPCLAWADGMGAGASLSDFYDRELQRQLERRIADADLSAAVDKHRLCITLVDLSSPATPRMAELNGDHMMYAASLPKIAILLGAFVEIERGRLRLDASTREALTRMIRVSSNLDATAMLNRVGKWRVNEILRSDRFRLYDPLTNGGLWVGKEYAKGIAYQRDPLHNISHGATTNQTARFYYLLETDQLVHPYLGRIMKGMLGSPEIEHKFVKGLANKPNVRIFRKSGSWRQWHADSAIVEAGRGHKYILVALADDPAGGEWLARIAPLLHEVVVPPQVALR